MEGCCSPLFSLFEEACGHGKDVSSAAALSGHHDAHIRAAHAPLHDILKRRQLVPVHQCMQSTGQLSMASCSSIMHSGSHADTLLQCSAW